MNQSTNKKQTAEEWLRKLNWEQRLINFRAGDVHYIVCVEEMKKEANRALAMARAQEREKTIAMIETLFLVIKDKSERERFEQWKKDWLGK